MKIDNRPSQWVGALLIVGWVGFLALGLPRIAAAIPNETDTVAGQPTSLGGVTLTPEAGWMQPADSKAIFILRKDGAQITALPPQPDVGDATAVLQPMLDRASEVAFLAAEAARQDGWGELTADEIALIGAPKPADKHARRLSDRVIAYAWAADRLEPGTRRHRRAAERLAAARSATA